MQAESYGSRADPRDMIESSSAASPTRARANWPFWLMLALVTGVLVLGVGELWIYGHHGWSGARRGIAGINYDKYGFVATRFGPVENYGHVEPKQFEYYWHHPVLIHVLVGVAFKVFGPVEWAGRLVPVALSVLTFVLLYLLTLRWWGRAGAVTASVLLAFLPLFAFYGKFVNHEPLVLALGVSLAYLQVRFHEAPRWRYVALAALVTLLGAFSDWPFFLALGACGFAELVYQVRHWRSGRDLRLLAVLTVVGAIGLVAVFKYLMSIQGSVGGFRELFSTRTRGGGGSGNFGIKSLWSRRDWYHDLWTPFTAFAGALWVAGLVPRALMRRLCPCDALIGASLFVGGAWMIVFAEAAYIHEYWCYYLVPFLVLSTSWLLLVVADAAGRWARPARPAVLALALLGFAAWGGQQILAYQRTPSDVGPEQPEFRFRHSVFTQWLATRTAPDERVVLQDDFPLKFQAGFYLDRATRDVRIGAGFRGLTARKGDRWLALDRTHVPAEARAEVLRALAERYPTMYFDRFAVYDLTAHDNRDQRFRAFRIVLGSPTLLWQWLESLVYPPYDVVESDADAFQAALSLGLDDAARRLAKELRMPSPLRAASSDGERWRIADWVAWHNARVLLGRSPEPALAMLRLALGAPLGMRLGGVATLLWAGFESYPGERVAATLVFRAESDGGEPLRPTLIQRTPPLFRVPWYPGTDRVWHDLDPLPNEWRRGMLYRDFAAFREQPPPRQLVFTLDREGRKEERTLRPSEWSEELVPVGLVLPGERQKGSEAPFAWIDEAAPGCTPTSDTAPADLPAACLPALAPALDLAVDILFRGDDELRLLGVKRVATPGGERLQALFTVPRAPRNDYRIRLGATPAGRAAALPGARLTAPEGDVKTRRWRSGRLYLVSFPASPVSGANLLRVRISREHHVAGGRIPVTGSSDRSAVVLPVPASLERNETPPRGR